jgi:hypothetical protein
LKQSFDLLKPNQKRINLLNRGLKDQPCSNPLEYNCSRALRIMPVPRTHHYIPVFYLKGFTSPSVGDKGYLWVYEQGKPFHRVSPVC